MRSVRVLRCRCSSKQAPAQQKQKERVLVAIRHGLRPWVVVIGRKHKVQVHFLEALKGDDPDGDTDRLIEGHMRRRLKGPWRELFENGNVLGSWTIDGQTPEREAEIQEQTYLIETSVRSAKQKTKETKDVPDVV